MCLTRSLKFFCLKCNSTSQLPWESPKSSNSVFQSFNKYFSGQDLLPQTLSEHSKFPTVPLCRNLKDSFTGVSGSRSCRHLWQPQPFHLLLLNSPLPKIIKVWFGFPLPTLPFIFSACLCSWSFIYLWVNFVADHLATIKSILVLLGPGNRNLIWYLFLGTNSVRTTMF